MASPKTELLSTRSAPVRNSRSRQPTCSCAKKPSDLTSTYSLQPTCVAARLTSRVSAEMKVVPCEMVLRYCRFEYCAPKENAEVRSRAHGTPDDIVPA